MLNPIGFSIPESKICSLTELKKTKITSHLIPGQLDTYIYKNEEEYYHEYGKSFFAVTMKKGGWDCLRHYEIIANGCIPYFIDIDKCPENVMTFFPKDLVKQGNALYERIVAANDFSDNNARECSELIKNLLDYAKTYLTTKKMAEYVLSRIQKKTISRILYLSGDVRPDYLRCLTLHGFKELLGSNCHDYPKVPHLYNCSDINYSELYGKGMTYSALLDQELHNDELDESIMSDIKNHHYDIVIYGSYHRGMPLFDLVKQFYSPNEIILFCGEDFQDFHKEDFLAEGYTLFVREL